MKKLLVVLLVFLCCSVAEASKMFWASCLTGGTTGCLDAIDGSDISAGDGAIIVLDSGSTVPTAYFYRVYASSSAESSPDVISPDSNASTKRWHLTGLNIGTKNLTMTGSIGATGARITKGWFTDIESTNLPTIPLTENYLLLGNASNVAAASNSFSMTFTVTMSEYVPVSRFTDGASAPGAYGALTLTGHKINKRSFSSASSQDLTLVWHAPTSMVDGDSGTAGFQVKWRPLYVIENATAPSAGEGVVFAMSACSTGDSDAADCTLGDDSVSAYADLNGHAQYDIVFGPWTVLTVTNGAANEVWKMKLYRDHDHASDDYGQDVSLYGVEIKWQATLGNTY